VSEAAKPAIRRARAGRVTDVGAPPLPNETKSLLKIAAAGNAVSGAGASKAANGQDHDWIGGSVWRMPEEDIKRVRSTTSFTTVSYHRGDGEATWRGDRHRLAFAPDAVEWAVVQIEQGPARQKPLTAAGSLTFFPPGVTLRTARPAGRLVQVLWDSELYTTLMPELRGADRQFEYLGASHDPLLAQIVTALSQEIGGGLGDGILIESLGVAMCIRLARQYLGRLPLPASKGLSEERLRRVRDYIEAHLDRDLSLTALAEVARLSPYHFSRSFKEATGLGPQRFVTQRRLERAKALLRRTARPLAAIARDTGFADQSHLTAVFRRETGSTPGRYRQAMG
jgi:AraC family transcriptional regulator